MHILNLTPHEITVFATSSVELVDIKGYKSLSIKAGEEPAMVLPPSGVVARASEVVEKLPPLEIGGISIPLIRKAMGEPVNLPEPKADTLYVVSLATAKSAPDRTDLLVVGESCRDTEGHIRGCVSLARP